MESKYTKYYLDQQVEITSLPHRYKVGVVTQVERRSPQDIIWVTINPAIPALCFYPHELRRLEDHGLQ